MPKCFADILTVQMTSVHCIFVSVAYINSHIANQNILFLSITVFFLTSFYIRFLDILKNARC